MIERIGSFAGLASFLGLGVFALLLFAHGRDIRRLREWAGSAPEREAERMEQTQTIAAQRAEELRALEEARTAEHEAVARREERRRRREEGLPELTRGERFRERFGGIGGALSRPPVLAALFVVFVLVVAGVAYGVLSGGDGDAKGDGHHTAKRAAPRAAPGEIEVAVLNGTSVPGLAATYGDKVERKGFELGAVTNSQSSFERSVVMFRRGREPEAKEVAKDLAIRKVRPMSNEVAQVSGGAKVSIVVGEDHASAAD